MTSKNNRAPLICYIKLCASFQIRRWIQTEVTVRKTQFDLGQNWQFFVPCDRWNLMDELRENNRAPLLYYIKLCALFQIHRGIQTGVTVRKRSIRVKVCNFLSCVSSKFYGWLWKTIGHLFCTTSSFMHHFKAMGEFKLELQSGNAQFWSKLMWVREDMMTPTVIVMHYTTGQAGPTTSWYMNLNL